MNNIKVLLVDDHPLARDGLRAMLGTTPDIEVVADAADGLEAVEKANEHHPDVVLMDLRMPNLDGLEATRRIKSQLPSIAVIVLTAYASDAHVVNAVTAGAGGYLLKDASRDLIVHTIRAVNSGGMLIKTSLLREAMLSLIDAPGAQLREKLGRSAMLEELTLRERNVLRLMIKGQTNREIGQALSFSADTAKKHVQSIMLKLGVSDRTQAAVKAVRAGLFDSVPGSEEP